MPDREARRREGLLHLAEGRLDEFVAKSGGRYDVSWEEDDVGA